MLLTLCCTSQTLTVPESKLRLLIAENERGKMNTQLLAYAQEQIGVYKLLVANRDSALQVFTAKDAEYKNVISAQSSRIANYEQQAKQHAIYLDSYKRTIKRQKRSKAFIIVAAILANAATIYLLK